MGSISKYWHKLSPAVKLTVAYVGILMVISLFFSVVLYNLAANQLANSLRRQYVQLQRPNGSTVIVPSGATPTQVQEELENGKQNLLLQLLYFNAIILALSGAISYLFAKQTVRPIEEALESQTRFTADASHELRTPLAAMQTEIEVTLRSKQLSLKDAKDQLESNLEEVEKLRNLSDGLLRLARTSESQLLDVEKIALSCIIQESIKRVRSSVKCKKITILNKTQEVELYAEKESITELLVILLDNAIKYSKEKSIITIKSKSGSRAIQILVCDEGAGIAKEDIGHIFERFYRSDDSRTKQTTTGYGLGLSIAAKIVHLHKGNISVKSKVGEGSTFTITLPRYSS